MRQNIPYHSQIEKYYTNLQYLIDTNVDNETITKYKEEYKPHLRVWFKAHMTCLFSDMDFVDSLRKLIVATIDDGLHELYTYVRTLYELELLPDKVFVGVHRSLIMYQKRLYENIITQLEAKVYRTHFPVEPIQYEEITEICKTLYDYLHARYRLTAE